jgi:NCS1 family nucleobase:cation symporter-1
MLGGVIQLVSHLSKCRMTGGAPGAYDKGVKFAVEDLRASIVEFGVPAAQKTMTADKVFWSHFCTNLAPATWVLGALLAGIGLDIRSGIVAIVLGGLLGALPVGFLSTLGPETGLTQMETSRFAFGRLGTRVPACFNWFCAVGWDAVNNVPSVLALLVLATTFGIGLPFWLGLAFLVSIQLGASICGHHVVQVLAKYLCYVLIVVFAVTGAVAVAQASASSGASRAISPATFVLGVSIVAGFNIGFAPYSSDYTRYLPRTTPRALVFTLSASGIFLSAAVLESFGLFTASRISDLSPAGVISAIATLMGPLAWVALVAIAVSAIPINSINDNTAAYSLISTGVRVPRHVSAIVTSLCGFVLAVAGAGKFAELFSNYLLLLLYWIAPWAGIVLADWWFCGGQKRRTRPWGSGLAVFAVVTPVTIALFSATEIYTGPLAKRLDGTDIGSFVGFFAAAVSYVCIERRRMRATSAKYVAAAADIAT